MSLNTQDIPDMLAAEFNRELYGMTTTELHALLSTTHLTAPQLRAIRAELRDREI